MLESLTENFFFQDKGEPGETTDQKAGVESSSEEGVKNQVGESSDAMATATNIPPIVKNLDVKVESIEEHKKINTLGMFLCLSRATTM